MATLSELRGRAVISLAEGEKLGTVKDLVLHPGDREIEGFVLETGGPDSFLPFGRFGKVGPDAIIVESKQAVEPAGQMNGSLQVADISKMEVMNSDGTKLGQVADIDFDLTTGALNTIELKAGGVFGLGAQNYSIPSSQIRAFGADVITIQAPSS
jgi:sporulation protein YlmC with PRC-barrel domain